MLAFTDPSGADDPAVDVEEILLPGPETPLALRLCRVCQCSPQLNGSLLAHSLHTVRSGPARDEQSGFDHRRLLAFAHCAHPDVESHIENFFVGLDRDVVSLKTFPPHEHRRLKILGLFRFPAVESPGTIDQGK